jgi:hypothetical protein
MKRKHLGLLRGGLASVATLGLFVAACSSDKAKPAVAGLDNDSGIVAMPPSGGGNDGGPRADGGDAATSDGGVCNTLVNSATFVDKTSVPAVLPQPAGGTIVEGTYKLTDLAIYNPSAPGGLTGITVKTTLVLQNGGVEQVSVSSNSPESRLSGTYTPAGNQVTLFTTCPTGRGAQTLGFSASGNLLLFISTTVNEVATYTRQ